MLHNIVTLNIQNVEPCATVFVGKHFLTVSSSPHRARNLGLNLRARKQALYGTHGSDMNAFCGMTGAEYSPRETSTGYVDVSLFTVWKPFRLKLNLNLLNPLSCPGCTLWHVVRIYYYDIIEQRTSKMGYCNTSE